MFLVILVAFTDFGKMPHEVQWQRLQDNFSVHGQNLNSLKPLKAQHKPNKPICASQAFNFIELFAGQGNCSRLFRYAKISAASVDIKYAKHLLDICDENPMDISTSAGFSFPGFLSTVRYIHIIYPYGPYCICMGVIVRNLKPSQAVCVDDTTCRPRPLLCGHCHGMHFFYNDQYGNQWEKCLNSVRQ